MINLIKYIFPENYCCFVCDRDIFDNPYFICKGCLKNLPYISQRVCLHCGENLISDGDYCKRCKGKKFIVDRALSPFLYINEIRCLIHSLKYDGKKYVSKCLAKFMADYFLKQNLFADIIIPIPLCDKRLKQRGYNQSELLANEISKHLNLKVNTESLKRVKETPTQTELTSIERQKNMRDAFRVYKPKLIRNKSVLLIDDVYTTGATVNECARVLKDAGVSCVYVLTAAHTILKKDKNKKGETNE